MLKWNTAILLIQWRRLRFFLTQAHLRVIGVLLIVNSFDFVNLYIVSHIQLDVRKIFQTRFPLNCVHSSKGCGLFSNSTRNQNYFCLKKLYKTTKTRFFDQKLRITIVWRQLKKSKNSTVISKKEKNCDKKKRPGLFFENPFIQKKPP